MVLDKYGRLVDKNGRLVRWTGKLFPDDDIDYRANDMPEDSLLWVRLLGMIRESGEQQGGTMEMESVYLYAHIRYLRFEGTRLVRSKQWGFVLEPVIGDGCWESREKYERMKKMLDPYRRELVALLSRLG